MKKYLALTALLSLLTVPAWSQQGGFQAGETPPPQHKQDAGYKGTEDTRENQITSIRDLNEGAWVTLEGNIIAEKAKERYAFRDKSGTLEIVIPEAAWKGKEFDAQDMVRISGRVHGKGDATVVHVERLGEP